MSALLLSVKEFDIFCQTVLKIGRIVTNPITVATLYTLLHCLSHIF